MFTHRQIWQAIDTLAERHRTSPSGLARLAGLDATTFNRSKRTGPDGRERWPSTESIAKILAATRVSFEEFAGYVGNVDGAAYAPRLVPLIGLAQAGGGGFFDDAGFPVGGGWDQIAFPGIRDENAYALEVTGDSMAPVYRDGDIIIVAPNATVRRGDRVVVKTRDGEIMAKGLKRRTTRQVELASFNPEHEDRIVGADQVEWMARIVWASQ